jgi:hypothetical protein
LTDIDGNAIVAEIAPGPRDIVIIKTKPSAFFGTPAGELSGSARRRQPARRRHDDKRLRTRDDHRRIFAQLPRRRRRGTCFDRSQTSHAIALCDLHAKYADVVSLEETLAFIRTLPRELFDLPRGR